MVAKKRVMGGRRLVTVRKSKDKGPTEFGALIYIYILFIISSCTVTKNSIHFVLKIVITFKFFKYLFYFKPDYIS